MVKLADVIPDPKQQEFVRLVKREWGEDWAKAFVKAFREGVLVDVTDEPADWPPFSGQAEHYPPNADEDEPKSEYEQGRLF